MMAAWQRPHFDNTSGRGVVAFATAGGDGWPMWDRYLTVEGTRVYHLGNICDTCEFLIGKLEAPSGPLSAAQLSARLRDRSVPPDDDTLLSLGSLLPPGDFAIVLYAARPTLVMPGTADDYFAGDQIRLFGREHDSARPHDPKTPYYRLGALVTAHNAVQLTLAIPLQSPDSLDRDQVEEYKALLRAGQGATVVTVGVLDSSRPYDYTALREWPMQHVLAQYVLDGHHKLQAAAEIGCPIRILSFVARFASFLAEPDAFDEILGRLIADAESR